MPDDTKTTTAAAPAPLMDAPLPSKQTTARELGLPVTLEASDQELLGAVAAHFHSRLAESPAALDFLDGRGLKSGELVEHFQLGFSDRTLGLLIPLGNRSAGSELRERLTRLGILRDTGHEHFRGCLTLPVIDEQGAIIQLYGHRVGKTNGTSPDVWLPAARSAFFNAAVLLSTKTVTLCADPFDALALWAKGNQAVLSLLGLDAIPEDIGARFKQHGAERVLIAFEGEAARVIAGKLNAEGIEAEPAKATGPRMPAVLVPAPQPERAPEASLTTAPAPPLEEPAGAQTPTKTEEPVKAESASAPHQAPSAPAPELNEGQDEVTIQLGERRYRARGLAKNLSFDVLRVNLLVARDNPLGTGAIFHVDTLDLYAAKQRASFIKAASGELGVAEEIIRHDLGKVLFRLEELQGQLIRKTLEPQEGKAVKLTPEEEAAALALLKDPKLLDHILGAFTTCGVVGEETNKLVACLAGISRKLDEPLAVMVQSSSAAGKTSLMTSALAFVPPEDRVEFSALTGQSLFYLRPGELRHKVLAIAEEEGAHRAAYALKLLQSERELTIGSTAKDPGTGRLVTQSYKVEGPVAVFTSTTAVEIDPELLNRCIVLTVNEDREQTRAIHRVQRERQTLEGLIAGQERAAVLRLHQNAQRLLRPLLVVNPYAPRLTFLDDRTRTRRDHLKYLALIKTVALLFQHQRTVKTVERGGETVEYIEVTPADIEVANRLTHEILGRSLDELPPHSRGLLTRLDAMVGEACSARGIERSAFRFSRRDVRDYTGWTDFQVRAHIGKLVAMEYVLVHRGGRGQLFEYELLYDGRGQDGQPFVAGLIEADRLGQEYVPHFEQVRDQFEPPSSSHRGPIEPSSSEGGNGHSPSEAQDFGTGGNGNGQIAHRGVSTSAETYIPTPPAGDLAAALASAAEAGGAR